MLCVAILLQVVLVLGLAQPPSLAVLGLAQPSSLAVQLLQLVKDLHPSSSEWLGNSSDVLQNYRDLMSGTILFPEQLFLEVGQKLDERMGAELQPDVYEMFARQTCTERATSWLLRVLLFQFPVELTERQLIVTLCILLAKTIPSELMTSDLLMAMVQHDCFPHSQYEFCKLIEELPENSVSKLEPVFHHFLR
jgi:hypothetical protein